MADSIQVLPNTKQALITDFVQRELKAAVNLLGAVTDVSRFAVKGAKSIAFPKLTSFSITDRSFGSAGDATALTDSVDTLSLDVNAYVASLIDASDEIQSSVEYKMEAMARMASAHGRYVDEKIIAVLSGGYADYINAAASAADITKNNVVDLRAALVRNNARLDDLYLAVSPDQEAALLKIDDFVRADAYGNSNIPAGVIGRVFGFNVILNNQIPAQTVYAFASEGLAIGFQKAPSMSEQAANEYGADSVRIAMDQLFGVKALQTAQGVKLDGSTSVAAGKSGLIFSLNE